MKAILYLKSSKWKKNRKKTHRKKYTNTNHRIKYDRESVFRLFAIFSNFIFSSWVKFSSCAITIDMVSCRCCTQLVRISSRRTFYVFIRFFLVSFSITHFTSLFPCCFFVVVDISFSFFFSKGFSQHQNIYVYIILFCLYENAIGIHFSWMKWFYFMKPAVERRWLLFSTNFLSPSLPIYSQW